MQSRWLLRGMPCGIEPICAHEYSVRAATDVDGASQVMVYNRVQDDLRIRFGMGAAEMGFICNSTGTHC